MSSIMQMAMFPMTLGDP